MKKIAMLALVVATCSLCVGCGIDKVENGNFNNPPLQSDVLSNSEEKFNLQEEFDKKEVEYVEGITSPVLIEETEDELRVNVKGSNISIYKFSGDFVTERYEKYSFATNEAAQYFVDEYEDKSKISIQDNIVIVNVEIPEGMVMKKSDLVKTYSELKDVYENER